MWNCTHFRHPTDEQLQNSDIFRSQKPFEYKRQYKFTCLQKRDKLLKYKCKVNVYQKHNTDILCYKFIFNQNINCQMSQKNLLLLVFFFKKKRFFNKFAINTVYTLPRTYNITSNTTFVTFLFFLYNMLTIYSIYTTYNTETTTRLLAMQREHY